MALLFPYLWSGAEDTGYYQVWLYEVDEINWCGYENIFVACYYYDGYKQIHRIDFVKNSNPFERDMYNCNTSHDHEFWHSMGYHHGEYPLVTC